MKYFPAEDLHIIEGKGSSSWPRMTDPALGKRVHDIRVSLESDYRFMSEVYSLGHRCIDHSNDYGFGRYLNVDDSHPQN